MSEENTNDKAGSNAAPFGCGALLGEGGGCAEAQAYPERIPPDKCPFCGGSLLTYTIDATKGEGCVNGCPLSGVDSKFSA